MEFVCDRSALQKGVAAVERAVATRGTMEVLANILVEAEGERLHLVATDLELGVECHVPAHIGTAGSELVDGKLFAQLVRKLEGESVGYRNDEGRARIDAGRARFSLNVLPGEEFPALPDSGDLPGVRIAAGTLERMIRQTVFASAPSEAEPVISGLLVEVEDDEIRMVATDTYRVAFERGKLTEAVAESSRAILPRRALVEVARFLGEDTDATVTFVITDNQAVFTLPGAKVVSRVIQGNFPGYGRIFELIEKTESSLAIDRQQLLAALERAALIGRSGEAGVEACVRLSGAENGLTIAAREAEVGESLEELNVTYEGREASSAYQARYLIEGLRATTGEMIDLHFSTEIEPGMRLVWLRPSGDDAYVYVVMPMRI